MKTAQNPARELTQMAQGPLLELKERWKSRYLEAQARGLRLDMTRGKPCGEQLDLSLDLLRCVTPTDFRSVDGTDCRNYGGLDGLPEAKDLFAELMGVAPDEILIGDNASLTLFHDVLVQARIHGVPGGKKPWGDGPQIRILCPVPGYDRHFLICEHLGMEMVAVAMGSEGPDLEEVRSQVRDESVKGIICVPRYSNPTGVTYSEAVVRGLAGMKTAAPDFRILWDNAYAVHHLTDDPDPLVNGLDACKEAGNPNRILMFGSTSKISFAGAGVSFVGASQANIDYLRKNRSIQTIGPDKLNQLRHVRFFGDMSGIQAHMQKHAALLRPKFDAVLSILDQELGGRGVAQWSRPRGGYFISLDTLDGCAQRVVELASEAGVKLTQAGATFPYGKDPRDRNLRIAPTLPPLQELREATTLLANCILLASLERLGS